MNRAIVKAISNLERLKDMITGIMEPLYKWIDKFRKPFPGVKITGIKYRMYPVYGHRRRVYWETAFDPKPRYFMPDSDNYPLGKFYGYDLYVVFQDPAAPLLVCRYGNAAYDHVVFNLVFRPETKKHIMLYNEALKRAIYFGFNWHTN